MTHKISVVVSWCDFFQEAARELGEGSFVLVTSPMSLTEDTLRQMCAHDVTMSMMSKMSMMPQVR